MTYTTTHYPTSAELAAFRRTIAPHYGSPLLHRDSPFMAPDTCTTLYGSAKHTDGAWPHEREHGIGYTFGAPCPDTEHTGCHDQWCAECLECSDIGARREANRLRHRAWHEATGAVECRKGCYLRQPYRPTSAVAPI